MIGKKPIKLKTKIQSCSGQTQRTHTRAHLLIQDGTGGGGRDAHPGGLGAARVRHPSCSRSSRRRRGHARCVPRRRGDREVRDKGGLDAAQVGKGWEEPRAMHRILLVPKEVDDDADVANASVTGGGWTARLVLSVGPQQCKQLEFILSYVLRLTV